MSSLSFKEEVLENYKRIKREIGELIGKELTIIDARHLLEETAHQPLEGPKMKGQPPSETIRPCKCNFRY